VASTVFVRCEPELLGTLHCADDRQLAQHGAHSRDLASGEKVRQVLERDAERVDGGEHLVGIDSVVAFGMHDIGDR